MELTLYQITLISGGFGIVGALLGSIISYRFALNVAEKQFNNSIRLSGIADFEKASNSLRSAFARQLVLVRLEKNMSATQIQLLAERSIDDITIELEKFRFFLNTKDLSAYDDACEEYQAIAGIRAMNYETLGGKNPFKVFENKVHNILQFTKL